MAVMKHGSWKTCVAIFTTISQHTKGSSGSWRATLFFVYSGRVAFSSIRSQGVPRPHPSGPQRMGSCSPKSALVLAEKARVLPLTMSDSNTKRLGKISLQGLQDIARQDITQKVTAGNVMTEYFSEFVNSCVCLSRTAQSSFTPQCSAVIRHCFVLSTASRGRSGMQKQTRWSGRSLSSPQTTPLTFAQRSNYSCKT